MAFECREKARAPGRGTGGALGQRAALMPTPVRGRIGMNVAPTLWSGADRHEYEATASRGKGHVRGRGFSDGTWVSDACVAAIRNLAKPPVCGKKDVRTCPRTNGVPHSMTKHVGPRDLDRCGRFETQH